MSKSSSTNNTATIQKPVDSANKLDHWRRGKWLALAELAVVALIFLTDARHLIPFSKTPFLLALACISLWFRRIGWRRIGLRVYRNWRMTIALGIAAGALLEALELFITQPLLIRWIGKPPDLETFR